MEIKKSFKDCLLLRMQNDQTEFYKNNAIQKAYFVGAYAKAIIDNSYNSEISKKNKTFKTWLSNQIINFRNLDRIFEKSYSFEQKLNLKLGNNSEPRVLVHEVPTSTAKGLSNSKISFAFVAGFDDYSKYSVNNNANNKD